MPFKKIARLVVRDNGEQADSVLGSTFKGQEVFQPGDVWEITEILGELVLRRVGKSHIQKSTQGDPSGPRRWCCWSSGVETILAACSGGYLTLTDREWSDLNKK